MTIHLLFYRPRPTDIIGRLICWQTRSRYSHVAMMFGLCTVIESHWPNGVSQRCLRDCDDAADKFLLPVNLETQERIYDWAIGTLNARYDTLGVFRFLSRRRMTNNRRWFCSEHAFEACRQGGVELLARTEAWEVSPGLLARSPLLEPEQRKT